MEIVLSPMELRVIGCLIEKQIATPDYYPLTLNSVVTACNQKSNRNPVMQCDEKSVVRALDELRWTHHLASQVTSSISRVPKYEHTVSNKWEFSPAETAVLCELFLRGPQTIGELRTHASRLHAFGDAQEVEDTLQQLVEEGDGPFVVKLAREPGRREQRWTHLMCGDVAVSEPESVAPPPERARIEIAAEDARIDELEQAVATLRVEVEALKSSFEEFKTQFE